MNAAMNLFETEGARSLSIAVVIPCFNEENTIGVVIKDFCKALPSAKIYVCNNASTDLTEEVARDAGAIVYSETRLGKGNAVRRLFSEVDADVFIIADGDDTYDASVAPEMINHLLEKRLDMVVCLQDCPT